MRIRKLVIKGFKSIESLSMENIPNLVVLAGPNGSGKSSIFDAIRLFKGMIGPYSPNEMGPLQTELRNELKNAVNFRSNEAEISLTIELSTPEITYLVKIQPAFAIEVQAGNGSLSGTLKIGKEGGLTPMTSPALQEILRHYDPTDELGTFEFIPSYREIPPGTIGQITLQPQLEQEKLERTADARAKFSRLKYYLIMMQLFDMMELSDTASKFLPQIQGFFKDFFYPKEFEGITVDKALNWHFPIKSPDGTHDVDFLSSGEKEILMTYTNVLRLKLTGAIILFDEPELHLNAALERKVIGRLNSIADAGNQVWVATHSLEIINTTPLSSLYRMYKQIPQGKDSQIELCSEKQHRFHTLQMLGASTGIQLISPKIVYVEGPTDREVLQRFYEEYGDTVSFVEARGVHGLTQLSYAIGNLLDEVSKYESFLMLRDRDFLTDKERQEVMRKFGERVYVWSVRTMENLLLNPSIVSSVLKSLGIVPSDGEEGVEKMIKAVADSLRFETLRELVESRLNSRFVSHRFGLPALSDKELEKEILKNVQIQRDSLVKSLSDEKTSDVLVECRQQVEKDWDSSWLTLCDGKKIMQGLIEQYIKPSGKKLDVAALRSLIVAETKENNQIPKEIDKVIRKHIT